MTRGLYIRALCEDHNIAGFTCGKPSIDDVLHNPERLAGCGDTYVVTRKNRPADVLACFTLLSNITDVDATSGPFEFVLLNILAVSIGNQRRGIGRWIIGQLIRDVVKSAEPSMRPYLLIEPVDGDATSYFKSLNIGFEELPSGRLVLPYETMSTAVQQSRRKA